MNACACDERSTLPEPERSSIVIKHEASRAARMVDLWENDIAHTLSRGALNMAQITLSCVRGLEARIPEFRWRHNHRRLSNWIARISTRRSFVSGHQWYAVEWRRLTPFMCLPLLGSPEESASQLATRNRRVLIGRCVGLRPRYPVHTAAPFRVARDRRDNQRRDWVTAIEQIASRPLLAGSRSFE